MASVTSVDDCLDVVFPLVEQGGQDDVERKVARIGKEVLGATASQFADAMQAFTQKHKVFSQINIDTPAMRGILESHGEEAFIKGLEELSEVFKDRMKPIINVNKLVQDYFRCHHTIPFKSYPTVVQGSEVCPTDLKWEGEVPSSTHVKPVRRLEVAEIEEIHRFMKDRVSHQYVTDGCDPRCKWSAYFLEHMMGVSVGRVKVESKTGELFQKSSDLFPDIMNKWQMHTAVFINGADGRKYVIDYVFDRPVLLEDWKRGLIPEGQEEAFKITEVDGARDINLEDINSDLYALYLFEVLDNSDPTVLKQGWRDYKPISPELRDLYDRLDRAQPSEQEPLRAAINDFIRRTGRSVDGLVINEARSEQQFLTQFAKDGQLPVVKVFPNQRIKIEWRAPEDLRGALPAEELGCYFPTESMLEQSKTSRELFRNIQVQLQEHQQQA